MLLRKNLIIILSSLSLVSCSSFVDSTKKYFFGDSKPEVKKQKPATQQEYNELLAKYNNLNDKYSNAQKTSIPTPEDKFSQVDELAPNNTQIETVDAFAQDAMAFDILGSRAMSEDEISQEVKYYKKGVALKLNNNLDAALKVFQYLQQSQTSQVRVRAKSHVADIYFKKNQYDLALQVNEDIIKTEAFSGKVLLALQNSVICAEKLKLENKRLQYQSMLTDFFKIEG
jgi:tetratricopeptide (TPR) repeat protein